MTADDAIEFLARVGATIEFGRQGDTTLMRISARSHEIDCMVADDAAQYSLIPLVPHTFIRMCQQIDAKIGG